MNSKDLILKKLRQAQVKTTSKIPPLTADTDLFADTVSSNETKVQRFEKVIRNLKGELYHFQETTDAAEFLQNMMEEYKSNSCISYDFELLKTLITVKPTLKKQIRINSEQFIPGSELAKYEVGITAADYLIARTGSVVVSSTTGGGRRLSILPPVHIVLATSTHIVDSIEDIWKDMAGRQVDWSTLSIISGPSRTSDIEKQLVLGAHGPKRLVIILIDKQ